MDVRAIHTIDLDSWGYPEGSYTTGCAVGPDDKLAAKKNVGIDPKVVQNAYQPRTAAGIWVPTQLPVFEPFSTAFSPWILPNAAAVRPRGIA